MIDMMGRHSVVPRISRPINIADGAWIGARLIILGGVTIASKAVIGAGSVVVHDIPTQCVTVSNPARVTKVWDPVLCLWRRVD